MNRLLQVKNDFVFKKLFGEPGSESILKAFLETVLKCVITELEIRRDTVLLKDLIDDKLGIIDIKAVINGKIKVNIELQVGNEYNIIKRSYFYLSKLYVEDFKQGDEYKDLSKIIVVNILYYSEFSGDDCHSVFRFKNQNNNEVYYSDICEIHFLELTKIMQDKLEDEQLKDWLYFIKTDNEEVIHMLANKNDKILEAAEKLEALSSDEKVRELADRRAKYLSDYNSNMSAAQEKGRKEGVEEGIEKGITESILDYLKFSTLDSGLIKKIRLFLDAKHDAATLTDLRAALYGSDIEKVKEMIS